MKIFKTLTAIILILSIVLLPLVTNAETVLTGKFKYMPAFEAEAEETYYYSDDYFAQSGTIQNNHLLAMSFNLAISTFEIGNYTYANELLENIGFKDIKADDMTTKPTFETIGTVIAHKDIDGHDVLAVAIRGEKYDSEWGNNFTVGKEGDAKGFSETSAKVLERIENYIKDNSLENVKIWMVGYSRAGAIADLAGVYINNNLDKFNTTADDLYVYTFETPAASLDDTVYDNIYIIKNVNDIVQSVYPAEWGFHTNGKIIEIGESKSMMTYTDLTEPKEYKEVEMKDFYAQFFTWLTYRLSRETYSEYLDEPISKYLDIIFSKSSGDRTKLLNFFSQDVSDALLENAENKNKLISMIWAAAGHNSDFIYHEITDTVIEAMNSVRNSENGSVITDEEYEVFTSNLYSIIRVIVPIALDDSSYYEGINYEEFYRKNAEDYYLTDTEMGKKYGESDGFDNGYQAGFEGLEKNEHSYGEDSEYGPIYFEAYKTAYVEKYLETYDLGQAHKNDLTEKAKYDARIRAKETGLHDGSHGEEPETEDLYLWIEDWMTEEYINAYNEEYERAYLVAYQEGVENPVEEEDEEAHELLKMYHIVSLMENLENVLKMHYPQTNINLVHVLSDYYNVYELIEGENQEVDISAEEVKSLTFKTSGPLDELLKVLVDNVELNAETDYELASGSTIVTLKPDFLKMLDVGEHVLKLVYSDSSVETSFRVTKQEIIDEEAEKQETNEQEQEETPKQGDEENQSYGSNTSGGTSQYGDYQVVYTSTLSSTSKDVPPPTPPTPTTPQENPKTGDGLITYVMAILLSSIGLVIIKINKILK